MIRCGHMSNVHGAGTCPRARGHAGEHLWWLTWEEPWRWRVVVYSGPAQERTARARGAFTRRPGPEDVMHLLSTLEAARKRQLRANDAAKRNPGPLPRAVPDNGKVSPRPAVDDLLDVSTPKAPSPATRRIHADVHSLTQSRSLHGIEATPNA